MQSRADEESRGFTGIESQISERIRKYLNFNQMSLQLYNSSQAQTEQLEIDFEGAYLEAAGKLVLGKFQVPFASVSDDQILNRLRELKSMGHDKLQDFEGMKSRELREYFGRTLAKQITSRINDFRPELLVKILAGSI